MERDTNLKARQKGFTLIELMVGLLLGLLLTGGVVALFIQTRQSFMIDENVARMQDHARFAMDQLTRDIRMASFVTEPLVPGNLTLDASLPAINGCGPAAVANWVFRLTEPGGEMGTIFGVDNADGADAAAAFGCITSGQVNMRVVDGVSVGSDIIAIKRAGGGIVPPAQMIAGNYYIQSNGSVAMLMRAPAVGAVGGPVDHWEYRPRIYYIRNFANAAGDGIPTLCRKVLSGAGMVDECIAQGIEDLQIEYGLDSDADGSANRYVASPTLAEFQDVVAARITILARSVQRDLAYTDDRTYSVGNSGDYTPGDNFHRRVYSETVTLHNLRNLQRLGI